MVPRSTPKRGMGSRSVPDPLKMERCISFLERFSATWPILAAILCPAGRQGAPKIKHFGTKSPKNGEKWGPGEGLENIWKNRRYLMRICEVLGMLNHGFSILQGNYSVGAFFAFFIKVSKHLRKCVPKWLPKGSKIELGGALGLHFWGFGRLLDDVKFWWVLGTAKSEPKIRKSRHLGGQRCLGW